MRVSEIPTLMQELQQERKRQGLPRKYIYPSEQTGWRWETGKNIKTIMLLLNAANQLGFDIKLVKRDASCP